MGSSNNIENDNKYPRWNNIPVAKGAVWSMKGLIWANSLPLYQEAMLRSGVAEEAQVRILLFLGLSMGGVGSEVKKLVLV